MSGKFKNVALSENTHKLIEEVAVEMQKNPTVRGKVSKAEVIHNSVLAMHKKVVKKS